MSRKHRDPVAGAFNRHISNIADEMASDLRKSARNFFNGLDLDKAMAQLGDQATPMDDKMRKLASLYVTEYILQTGRGMQEVIQASVGNAAAPEEVINEGEDDVK